MRHMAKLVTAIALSLALAQGVALENQAQGTINAALELWTLPAADNGLTGIVYDDVDGAVFYAAFNRDRIGRLTPATGDLTEWPVGDGPVDLALGGAGPLLILQPATIYVTESLDNRIALLEPITNGYHAEPVLTPGGFPNGIDFYASITRPGEAWFSERNSNRVGRVQGLQNHLSPVIPTQQRLAPTTRMVSVRQTLLSPTLRRGNPMLAPAVMLAPHVRLGNVEEWDISGFYQGPSFPESVAVNVDGKVWIANSAQSVLLLLDPDSDVMEFHGLPAGSRAVDVKLDLMGNVWYTTGYSHRIGRLDPASGDVMEWTLPTAGQPLNLAVGENSVWFTEREGDRLGWFDPTSGELLSFQLPVGTHPLDLAAVAPNEVWFTSERQDVLGHLTVTALGAPPAP
mgnify:CR=1 FL=1